MQATASQATFMDGASSWEPSELSSRRTSEGSIVSVELFWQPRMQSKGDDSDHYGAGGERMSAESSATSMGVHDAELSRYSASAQHTKGRVANASWTTTKTTASAAFASENETPPPVPSGDRLNGVSKLPEPVTPQKLRLCLHLQQDLDRPGGERDGKADGHDEKRGREVSMHGTRQEVEEVDLASSTASSPVRSYPSANVFHTPTPASPALHQKSSEHPYEYEHESPLLPSNTVSLAASPASSYASTVDAPLAVAEAFSTSATDLQTVYNRRSASIFTTWGLANPSRQSLVSLHNQTLPAVARSASEPTPFHTDSSSTVGSAFTGFDSNSASLAGDTEPSPYDAASGRERQRTYSSPSRFDYQPHHRQKNGRKQPPRLTESLELLATMSISPRTAPDPLPNVDAPISPGTAGRGSMGSTQLPMRIVEVELPPLEPGAAILMKMPRMLASDGPAAAGAANPAHSGGFSAATPTFSPTRFEPIENIAEHDRRKSSQQSFYSRISRRQSSLPALDPASVRSKAADNGPRFSLFPNSAAHRKIAELRFNRRPSPDQSADAGPSSPASAAPGLSCSGTATESTCGTWDMDEVEPVAEPQVLGLDIPGGKRPKESRKQRKARQKAEKARFDAHTPPDKRELFDASMIEVIDDKGERFAFGELVRGKKTIVVFLRHWFCSMCAQYMKAMVRDVKPEALEEAGVQLIVIGNGSARMIDGYAYKHFRSPFRTYTDPTLSLYRALGLTRQTTDAGLDEDKGDYLTESVMEQTVATVKRATKMPLRNPGHFTQLGGEFIFDGPMNVLFTHRMINTRDHAPIRDVCAEAGVMLEHIHYEPGPPPPELHRPSAPVPSQAHAIYAREATPADQAEHEQGSVTVVDPDEEPDEAHAPQTVQDLGALGEERQMNEYEDWKAKRDATLARMKMRKALRSEGVIDLKRSQRDLAAAAQAPV